MNESNGRIKAATSAAEREIIVTRVVDAPREIVFRAWTDPHYLAEWWGPKGITITTLSMDLRPCGIWQFVMRGPHGVANRNRIVYIDVVKPEHLIYKHAGEEREDPFQFHVMVTFQERACRTRLTVEMLFDSAGDRDCFVRRYGALEGATQTLERLEQQLAKITARKSGLASIAAGVCVGDRICAAGTWQAVW